MKTYKIVRFRKGNVSKFYGITFPFFDNIILAKGR